MKKYCTVCVIEVDINEKTCPQCGNNKFKFIQGHNILNVKPINKAQLKILRKKKNKDALKSIFQTLTNPKHLMVILGIVVVWTILAKLSAYGINPWFLRVISIMSFAQGGMYGGMVGAIGGLIAKVVFIAFVITNIIPLFMNKSPLHLKPKLLEIKNVVSSTSFSNINELAQVLIGFGISLIVYNFFAGMMIWDNSIIAIIGLLMSFKLLINEDLFPSLFLISIFEKKEMPQLIVARFLIGYCLGNIFA